MARQVLPIVGQAIGGYFGGPWGAMIGGMIGSALGNAIDPLIVRGPKLGEAGLQTSAEGVFRPIVMGTAAVKGNIICRGNRYIKIKRETQGKGSGPKTETERVYWTFAIRVCEAPDVGTINLLRVWQDGKLVFDRTAESTIPDESYDFWNRIRFYDGSESQLPDPALEAFKGINNTPAYRGSVYVVFPNWDLTDFGERIPDFRFEVSTTVSQATWDKTWNSQGDFPSPFSVGQVFYSSYYQYFVSCRGEGILKNPDGESPWEVLQPVNCFHGAEDAGTGQMAFLFGGNAYLSLDGGETISFAFPGIDPANTAHLRRIPEDLVYYTMKSTGEGIMSSPSGAMWNFGGPIEDLFGLPYWVKIPGGSYICVSEFGQVFRSGTGMGGWSRQPDIGILPGSRVTELLIEPNTNVIYATCTQGQIFASYDRADSFVQIHSTDIGTDFMGGVCVEEMRVSYFTAGSGSPAWTSDSGATMNVMPSGTAISTAAFAWSPERNALLAATPGDWYLGNISVEENTLDLRSIVSRLCERAGLDASRYDASNLTDLVAGIVFADDYTCSDAVRTLMAGYFFDVSEHDAGSGYRIHFPLRGREVAAVLTIDDFVDIPDKTIRQDAYERPRVLHLAYQSPKVGYAPAKASPMRFSPDIKVVGEVSAQIPVSFTDVNEVWRRADTMLKCLWTGVAGEEEFTLTDKYLRLVTSDAVGVVLRGQVRRMVITEQRFENGTLVCKLIADRQSNYTSNITGIPLPTPTPPPPSVVSSTIHIPLDLPALNDNNDRLLSYHAATGQTDVWPGALIERSVDAGSSYEDMLAFTQNSIIGVLTNELSSASPHYTDRTNVLRISLFSDDVIDSLTQQQLLSEGGSIAVSRETSSGRKWEVMQYRDAIQDSNDTWELSYLLRGRMNTDAEEHVEGDYVVLLDTVQSANNVTSHIGRELTYRATSVSRSPDGSPVYSEEYTGQSQREWPVANILLSRVGSTVTGRIVPRHRFGTELNPVRSINWSGYAISIRDATDQVFGFDTLSDSFSHDASGMTFPLDITVRQLNRITGAGEPVTETIE